MCGFGGFNLISVFVCMLSFRPCMASLSRVGTGYDLMSVCASVCVCVSSIVVFRAVGVVALWSLPLCCVGVLWL